MPAVIKHMQMRVKDPLTGEYTMVDTMRGPKGDKGDKGDPGEPGTGVSIHICSSSEYDAETRVPTVQNPESNTFYLVPAENAASPDMFVEWIFANGDWEMFGSATVEVPVQDVQVNGVSVLQDGVANVPTANVANGVVPWASIGGYGVYESYGKVRIEQANSTQTRQGSVSTKAITPQNQHESAFYGFAKAAGSDAKNSTLPVGKYAESAKSAISTMLNAPITVSGTTPFIAAMPASSTFAVRCQRLT